ncbi:response regulator [Nostoc sp. FACHB-152]|uniref:response regulator n=1 Tax=unclassified Nostoc TaxID=2593658 RepID=UPI00168515CD|nr:MULTISPECIES: response regulator [unclassified Nostoc]MBD2449008.1 response regulator [Nostoc sp. FACHB-152]MBD2469738.1 response regulator [Nostoc sp. FACHB-145]
MYPSNRFLNNLSSLQGLQVLIVDDNVDFCDLMTILLQLYGVEVRQAFSVPQALEIFEQWQPYIVVSDIGLPKEDGYALIQQVKSKAKELGQVVLAIAVTGYDDEEMCQQGLSAGFDLWFTKPLDMDEFVAVLARLAICQQSSYAIAQQILGHVSGYGDLSLEQQLEPLVSR